MPAMLPLGAQELRSVVQPKTGTPSPLAKLSDVQLMRVAEWAYEGKSSGVIAQEIREGWGKCRKVSFQTLQTAILVVKGCLFARMGALPPQPTVSLDALAENAILIKEFQKAWREANETAKTGEKAQMEHADRLGRLLSDAIQNQVSMTVKLQEAQRDAPPEQTPVNIGQLNVILSNLASANMPAYIDAVTARLEAEAKPRGKSAAPIDVKATRVTNPQ